MAFFFVSWWWEVMVGHAWLGLWVADVVVTAFVVSKVRWFWVHRRALLESLLCEKLCVALAKELDLDVMLAGVRVTRTSVVLTGLSIGEETDDAPYSASFGEIAFETADLASLATLGGLAKFRSEAVVCGFTVHEVEAITLKDVVATLYDEAEAHGKAREGRRKEGDLMPKMFRAKKRIDEQARTKRERTQRRRSRLAKDFEAKWHPQDPDDVFREFLSGISNLDADWRVGRFAIEGLDVDLYGHFLHVDRCAVLGFAGTTAQLKRAVQMEVLQEMVGPRTYARRVDRALQFQKDQVQRDLRTLRASVRKDFRPSVAWRSLRTFLWKRPDKKIPYKLRLVYKPEQRSQRRRASHLALPPTKHPTPPPEMPPAALRRHTRASSEIFRLEYHGDHGGDDDDDHPFEEKKVPAESQQQRSNTGR